MMQVNHDIQGTIHLAENLGFSSRTKHIRVRESFLVAMHKEKIVSLKKIHTDDNATDMFIKPLGATKFEDCSKFVQLLKC